MTAAKSTKVERATYEGGGGQTVVSCAKGTFSRFAHRATTTTFMEMLTRGAELRGRTAEQDGEGARVTMTGSPARLSGGLPLLRDDPRVLLLRERRCHVLRVGMVVTDLPLPPHSNSKERKKEQM